MLSQKSKEKTFSHIKDDTSELKLRDYIAKCTDIETEIKKIIKDKLAAKDKVIVWGTGTHTQRLLSCGLDISKIQYFVDSNTRYTGKKLKGTEIKLPAAITEPEYPILISTYTYQKEIAHQIRNVLKLKNEIITIYNDEG
ncbi:MAG: hypothetical protein HQK92_16185 [Nitrospirae bacterium]|nr:hypothetical protein [Nitrospirota bacterium]